MEELQRREPLITDDEVPAPFQRIKIITLGPPACGKSCLIKRYCEKRFVPKYMATIGVDYGITVFPAASQRDVDVQVNFFDLAGADEFEIVRQEFYSGTQGILLVFDVTSKESFAALERFCATFQKHIDPEQFKHVLVNVCANQVDKPNRVVDSGPAKLWAEKQGFRYFETSALTGDGVTDALEGLFSRVAALHGEGVCPSPVKPSFSEKDLAEIDRIQKASSARDVLGISNHKDSPADVNRAYKRLATLLHPDKNRAPDAEAAFKKLVAARTELLQEIT
eukprot:m.114671 g.114671  ORF g.114671 m.114671 type:complete len:280 (+) comp22944_c0_seq4:156-995(+)